MFAMIQQLDDAVHRITWRDTKSRNYANVRICLISLSQSNKLTSFMVSVVQFVTKFFTMEPIPNQPIYILACGFHHHHLWTLSQPSSTHDTLWPCLIPNQTYDIPWPCLIPTQTHYTEWLMNPVSTQLIQRLLQKFSAVTDEVRIMLPAHRRYPGNLINAATYILPHATSNT